VATKSTRGATSKDAAARRARVEEMRRAAKARERRVRLAVLGVGGVVVLAVVAVIVFAFLARQDKKTAEILPGVIPPGSPTTQKPPKSIPDDSGIAGVQAWDTTAKPAQTNQPAPDPAGSTGIEHDHVDGPVTYAVTPPVGGPHNSAWMTCGRYVDPVPAERAVHDLEHGAVWITYRKSLPHDQVKTLTGLFGRQQNAKLKTPDGKEIDSKAKYLDLSPWADDSLPAPIVVSAWGRQLRVDSPTDERIQKFIDTFRLRTDLSYEAGAQCTDPGGGIGGRPAAT